MQDESLKRLFTILTTLEQKQHEYEIRAIAQQALGVEGMPVAV